MRTMHDLFEEHALLALIEGMDEAALDAFAAEIDERLDPEQLQAKKEYKSSDKYRTDVERRERFDTQSSVRKISTKRLLSMAKDKSTDPKKRQAIINVLKSRIESSRRSGKLKLRPTNARR